MKFNWLEEKEALSTRMRLDVRRKRFLKEMRGFSSRSVGGSINKFLESEIQSIQRHRTSISDRSTPYRSEFTRVVFVLLSPLHSSSASLSDSKPVVRVSDPRTEAALCTFPPLLFFFIFIRLSLFAPSSLYLPTAASSKLHAPNQAEQMLVERLSNTTEFDRL